MSDTPSRRSLALLLSAAVCPGAGQFVQRRPLWGAALAVAFAVPALLAIERMSAALWATFRSLFDLHTPPPIAWRPVLGPLALALAVYAVSLVDVWRFNARRAGPPPLPPQA